LGETSTFECSACGYKSSRIRWGVGESDPHLRFLPGVCHHCQELVEVDLTGRDILIEEFTCSRCGRPVFFFEKAESYNCPRCKAPNVRIKQGNYW
jgi:ribosomal protein L37E